MFNLGDIAGWLVPTAAIGGWVLLSLFRLYLVGRTRDQAHRERMAMIERGLQPPAEAAATNYVDWKGRVYPDAAARNRRTGIILIGVGVGLAVMLAMIGTGGRTMGASAFLIVLGLAFLIISMFDRRTTVRAEDEVKRT
jgi:hypothetical protein